MTEITRNELELIRDLVSKFANQVPRLLAHIDAIELEAKGLADENKALRMEVFRLENQLHEQSVLKSPGAVD